MKQDELDNNKLFSEYRCFNCNGLLFKAKLNDGLIEIVCRRCKKNNYFRGNEIEFQENKKEN